MKARPQGPPPRAVSKLHAGRRLGFPAKAAGLCAALGGLLVVVAVLATGGRGQQVVSLAQGIAQPDPAALGLVVGSVDIRGATPAARAEIAAAAQVRRGAPIFSLDLTAIRERVERVGWVEKARVIRLWPDTLRIDVVQRPLLAVWQEGGVQRVVTSSGAIADGIRPATFPDLPLIVGPGANTAASPLLSFLQAHPKLMHATRAAVRVDQRRWDLDLVDGTTVLLPALGEAAAIDRLETLDHEGRVLSLKFDRIDLRDPEMVVVRPRGAPPPVSDVKG